ncbi:hypothetical protein B0H16DRAFT_374927 [Mycena metata]|uniref:F-box domain-containing protein n=1 Tax=Mycena metata TaxID=1033252 RepID=A0AAD7JL98_9AGAR|nr:hypothetical protein B0H16DRAFT_374927 [Mycena metata]
MIPEFPTELIEFFLDYLVDWEAKRSLARCALVCKAWHYPSTSRRFAMVLLDNDDIEGLFELAKTSLVPLPDFIRRLRFYEDAGHPLPPDQIMAIREMHRVQELCLTLSDNSIHRHERILSTTFTSLHTLKFYFRYNNSMDIILPLLSLLPSIRNLKILHARHNFFSIYSFPPDYRFPPNITTLAIQTRDINGLFEQILSLRPLPLFSSIVWLGFVGWDELDSPIGRYLRQAGAALHHGRRRERARRGAQRPAERATDDDGLCVGALQMGGDPLAPGWGSTASLAHRARQERKLPLFQRCLVVQPQHRPP